MIKSLERSVKYLFGLRVFFWLTGAFVALTGPHVWRQYDTLGVTLRYFNRWSNEGFQGFKSLLPAILQSGNAYGINAMEFPILNLVLAPVFFLGPIWGKSLASLILITLNLSLTWWAYQIYKKQKFFGFEFGVSPLLLILLSFSHPYFGKFMPDYFSMISIFVGVGLIRAQRKLIVAIALIAIGGMLKPTNLNLFILFLPMLSLKYKKELFLGAVSVALAGVYFIWGVDFINSHSDISSMFSTKPKSLTLAISQIFSDFIQFFHIFHKRLFLPFLWIIPLLYFFTIGRSRFKNYIPLILCLLIQIIFVNLVTGNHAFWHTYYYLGVAPLACLLFGQVLNSLPDKFLKVSLAALLVFNLIESFYGIKPLFKSHKKREWRIAAQCKDLKNSTPEFPWNREYPFRSPDESYPILGTCFGEKQGSVRSGYGLFYKENPIPKDCLKVKESQDLVLVRCD
ncbi:MAG: hypothetical protein ACPGJV_02985 [Bacteriovoracaceae bacterium]